VRDAQVDGTHVELHFHHPVGVPELGVRTEVLTYFAARLHGSSLPGSTGLAKFAAWPVPLSRLHATDA
jgi:hypothetical protein